MNAASHSNDYNLSNSFLEELHAPKVYVIDTPFDTEPKQGLKVLINFQPNLSISENIADFCCDLANEFVVDSRDCEGEESEKLFPHEKIIELFDPIKGCWEPSLRLFRILKEMAPSITLENLRTVGIMFFYDHTVVNRIISIGKFSVNNGRSTKNSGNDNGSNRVPGTICFGL